VSSTPRGRSRLGKSTSNLLKRQAVFTGIDEAVQQLRLLS